MRKILLFIILHLAVVAGAQETLVKTVASSGETKAIVQLQYGLKKFNHNSILLLIDGSPYRLDRMPEIKPEEIVKVEVSPEDSTERMIGSGVEMVIRIWTSRRPGNIVVRDREDRKPLTSASLVFNECYQEVNLVADENGRVDTKEINPGRMPVEVSCIGYKKKTVLLDINKSSIHEIELERDYDTLQQVVVTGYQTIRCGRMRGCGGVVRRCEIITDTAASPASLNHNYLQLYPNPSRSNNSIYLRLPSEKGSRLEAQLLNASGQLIKTITLQPGKTTDIRFDLPQLTAGMYYVRVTDVDLRKSYVGNVVVE